MHLIVDVYVQHPLSLPKFYDGTIEEVYINLDDIININEEDLISKLYEQVLKGYETEVHEDIVQDDKVQDGGLNEGKVNDDKVNDG